MSKIIVSDASTLVLLQKIVLLDKLVKKFNFIIPQEVYNEAVIKGKNIKSKDAYLIEDKIKNKTIKVKNIKDKKRFNRIIHEFGLGEGETEAIVLFFQEKADTLATDDHKAINVCKIHKIPFMTSLTFTLTAFELGIINKNEVNDMIKDLGIYGKYKSQLIDKALSYLGEKNGY